MIRFSSRNYPDPESFVKKFIAELTPGIIPRSDFIKWDDIEQKIIKHAPVIEFYTELRDRILQGKDFFKELADSLLACDEPLHYIYCAFEILGHTDKELVTKQDDINLNQIAKEIEQGVSQSALHITQLLLDLGFEKVLKRKDLEAVLLGVYLGLETHRRKNVGGEFFKEEVKSILKKIIQVISYRTGKKIDISGETKLKYGNGLSKTVDFAIEINHKNRFGIEVNFYTVPGSKPTEIKRSYGNIREGLLSIGSDLIWITDGKGYRKMQRSLSDAYMILPNIYNLQHVIQFLADDLIDFINTEYK